MTHITKIDRDAAHTINSAALAALQKVAEEHGLTVANSGNTRYEPETGAITVRYTFALPDRSERTYGLYRDMFGLPELGAQFSARGRTFTIIGFDEKRRTRPVQCRGDDGKTYIFATDAVTRLARLHP